MEGGIIQPGEHFRVYFEFANKRALSAQKAAEKHLIPPERAKAYVETDVCEDTIEMERNPLTGKDEVTVRGPVKLKNATMAK